MDKIRACIPLPFSISNRNLLEETKAISVPERIRKKSDDISSFIISPIYVGTSFSAPGRIGRLHPHRKNSCIIEYLIFCHLLVGFESISCQNLVRLFDTQELVEYSFPSPVRYISWVSNLSNRADRMCALLPRRPITSFGS